MLSLCGVSFGVVVCGLVFVCVGFVWFCVVCWVVLIFWLVSGCFLWCLVVLVVGALCCFVSCWGRWLGFVCWFLVIILLGVVYCISVFLVGVVLLVCIWLVFGP